MTDHNQHIDATTPPRTNRDEDFSLTNHGQIKTGSELDSYVTDIADTVRLSLEQSISVLTPWFFNNMPSIYYQATPRSEKVKHLSSIITGQIFESKQTVELWDSDRSKVTYIGPGSDTSALQTIAKKLSHLDLKIGSHYYSRDKKLFLSSFFCNGHRNLDLNNSYIREKVNRAKEELFAEHPQEMHAKINSFIDNLDNDFVTNTTSTRLKITFRMFEHLLHHEGSHTFVESQPNSPILRITFGLKGVPISAFLENVLHLVNRYEFDTARYFVVQITEGTEEPINIMHLILEPQRPQSSEPQEVLLKRLVKALRTLGWVDNDEFSNFTKEPFNLSINATNLVRTMASWIHILQGKENPYYFSDHKIISTYLLHKNLTFHLIDLFRIRFDPTKKAPRENGEYAKFRSSLLTEIDQIVDQVERRIFTESVKFLDHILKTNYFLPTKTGLALRLDPHVLDETFYPEMPFGIFFITGRDYRFFHVRWKDISRGGLRVVMPRNMIDHNYAISGLFDEVYGLSKAQQLKNKDIPEGGSKAVLVLRPGGNKARTVRAAINALLDLLVIRDENNEDLSAQKISYYDSEEILYLGPDENMTNDLIEWVAKHAEKRGYKYANAFISSKPGEGINHKQYGVTSEGLHVFVDYTLRYLGIDPLKQKFTVKMTGGPDGDVAGNELKILYRSYKENARVVAISDGYGAAYDSEGLDWGELLELIKQEKSICFFNPEKLKNRDAYVIKADTNANIKKRNELHAYTKADIFIPAGGRPYTVNEKNCYQFITDKGPSCRAIIEGANIFFTDEARKKLQEAGIIMIKDSSANKTGVICSSYEVIASLLLSKDEFLAIKNIYVDQVLDILRKKAGLEAELLFKEYHLCQKKTSLVNLSYQVSKAINSLTDILLQSLEKRGEIIDESSYFKSFVLDHVPQVLLDKYRDRIISGLPGAHKIAIVAASIASHIVYKEGVHFLDEIQGYDIYDAVVSYTKNEHKVMGIIHEVEKSQLKNKDLILKLLEKGAIRDLTSLSLEKR